MQCKVARENILFSPHDLEYKSDLKYNCEVFHLSSANFPAGGGGESEMLRFFSCLNRCLPASLQLSQHLVERLNSGSSSGDELGLPASAGLCARSFINPSWLEITSNHTALGLDLQMFQQQFAIGKTEGKGNKQRMAAVLVLFYFLLLIFILEGFVHTSTSLLTYIHSHMVSEIQLVQPLQVLGFGVIFHYYWVLNTLTAPFSNSKDGSGHRKSNVPVLIFFQSTNVFILPHSVRVWGRKRIFC